MPWGRVLIRAISVALICVLLRAPAYGDPPIHIKSPSQCTTEGGSKLSLPPGFFLDESTWGELDTEVKRLQDSETRLKAENKVLAESTPAWFTVAGALLAGALAGYYLAK